MLDDDLEERNLSRDQAQEQKTLWTWSRWIDRTSKQDKS